jgi:hypothetical protein
VNFKGLMITTVLAAAIAPAFADPVAYCVAVNGGFNNGGTSFVARQFDIPGPSKCSSWSGYAKTASTVVFFSSGTACLSSSGTIMTVSITSADPSNSPGVTKGDFIRFCPDGVWSCPIGGGQDVAPPGTGVDSGAAAQQPCNDDLLYLPDFPD